MRIIFDHAALAQAGQSRPDGTDVRLYYQNNSIPRSAGLEELGFNTSTAHLFFRLQVDLPTGATTSDYHLYFGGTPTAPPVNTGVPAFRVRTVETPAQTLTTTSYRDLLNLQLSRATTNERWMIVASWKPRRRFGDPRASARFRLLEGVTPLNGLQDLSITQNEDGAFVSGTATWYAGRPNGNGGPIIKISGRAPSAGSALVEQLRLTAFLLPRAPTPTTHFVEENARSNRTAPSNNLAGLGPSSEDRLWFARGSHRRSPSTDADFLTLDANGGFVAHTVSDFFSNEGDSYYSLVHFDRLRAQSQTSFSYVPGNMGSWVQGLGQMAVPVSWFASTRFIGPGAPVDFATTPTNHMSLVAEDYGSEVRDWVVLSTLKPAGDLGAAFFGTVDVEVDGAQSTRAEVHLPNGFTSHSFVWADTGLGTIRPPVSVIGTRMAASAAFGAAHGSLISLSYRDPDVVYQALEP